MAYKNPKELLVDVAKYPAAIEAMLPEAAPKLSATMVDTAERLPDLPDFPVEIPAFPAAPGLPAVGALGRPSGVKEVGAVERAPAPVHKGRTRFLY